MLYHLESKLNSQNDKTGYFNRFFGAPVIVWSFFILAISILRIKINQAPARLNKGFAAPSLKDLNGGLIKKG